jgi:hypothetical protein
MLNITKALQERIRNLSTDMADVKQLERAAQYEEDDEWVIVEHVQMTHPTIPHNHHLPTGEGIELDGEQDEETEPTQWTNSSVQAFQPEDLVQNSRAAGPSGNWGGGKEPATLNMEIFPSDYNRGKSTEERRPSEDEISSIFVTAGANELEDENIFQHDESRPDRIESYDVGQQMKRGCDELEPAQRLNAAADELRQIDLDTPKQVTKPRDDVLIKYHFMAIFRLLHEQYQEIKSKLVDEIFTNDIWQTWEYISEEDRAAQIAAFRSDVLFRDYREGHCLNQDKFRDEKNLVVFDSYLEQLVDLCCQQWSRDEPSGSDSEVTPMEVVPRKPEVLRQEVAEDICRNFMLVEPV